MKTHSTQENCLLECVYQAKFYTNTCMLGEICIRMLISFHDIYIYIFTKITNWYRNVEHWTWQQKKNRNWERQKLRYLSFPSGEWAIFQEDLPILIFSLKSDQLLKNSIELYSSPDFPSHRLFWHYLIGFRVLLPPFRAHCPRKAAYKTWKFNLCHTPRTAKNPTHKYSRILSNFIGFLVF